MLELCQKRRDEVQTVCEDQTNNDELTVNAMLVLGFRLVTPKIFWPSVILPLQMFPAKLRVGEVTINPSLRRKRR